MSALSSFSNEDFQSLTIWKDDQGREYYRAIDVCSNLRHSNPTQAISRHVDPKYVIQIDDGTNRAGKTNYLSEPGLYQLIFASRTEWAVKFQQWVFEDVLPKLRSSGYYIAPTITSEQVEQLQAEVVLLKGFSKYTREVFEHLFYRCGTYSKGCYHRPTYEQVFKFIDHFFIARNDGVNCYSTPQRRRNTLNAWKPYAKMNDKFYGDVIEFLQCFADNRELKIDLGDTRGTEKILNFINGLKTIDAEIVDKFVDKLL